MLVLALSVTVVISLIHRSVSISCPSGCSCTLTDTAEVIANCRRAGLLQIPPMADFDPLTTVIDLSHNAIKYIRKDTFVDLSFLTTIYLDDNEIDQIEPFSFRDLINVHVLSLRNNRITKVPTNSFSYLTGSDACLDAANSCWIDLRLNDIRVVEKNAFAWTKQLNILIGTGKVKLDIMPYAFYGVSKSNLISLGNVPQLSIGKHAFTDVQEVREIEIHDTDLTSIRPFTFEGLRSVQTVSVHDCRIDDIETYAFGGIQYTVNNDKYPNDSEESSNSGNLVLTSTALKTDVKDANGAMAVVSEVSSRLREQGSLVNITKCTIKRIHADAFRDTNIVQLIISQCDIRQLDSYILRGLSSVKMILIANNSIESILESTFSSLSQLSLLAICYNKISAIPSYAFHESSNIEQFFIVLAPHSSLLLMARSMSDVMDVDNMAIFGSEQSQLRLDADAFRGLNRVRSLLIVGASISHLKINALRGMNKVQSLQMISCNISHIDASAFGMPTLNYGFVDEISFDSSNRLACSCDLNKVVRELTDSSSLGTFTCVIADGQLHDFKQGLFAPNTTCAIAAEKRDALNSGSSIERKTGFLIEGLILTILLRKFLVIPQ